MVSVRYARLAKVFSEEKRRFLAAYKKYILVHRLPLLGRRSYSPVNRAEISPLNLMVWVKSENPHQKIEHLIEKPTPHSRGDTMKRDNKVIAIGLLLSGFLLGGMGSSKAAPLKLGKVQWGRDLDQAFVATQSSGKPVLV